MTGTKSFETLRSKMSPERRARNAAETETMLKEIALHELREARARSQADLASALGVDHPSVVEMEQRTDAYVGHLRRYVEALGGTLEIKARFPDTEIVIDKFEDLAGPNARPAE